MTKRHRQERQEPPDQREGLWVVSDVLPDGTYVVSISLDGDHSWVLTHDQVQRYASACVAAAQRAEFDAAVLRLLRHLGLPDEDAAAVIALTLRPYRTPLDDAGTAPLTLVPGVNAVGMPFIGLFMEGEQVGQLDTDPLRGHSMFVLGAPRVEVNAGTGCWAYLLGQLGVDVIACDRHPVEGGNHWRDEIDHRERTGVMATSWHPVRRGTAHHARQWPHRICCCAGRPMPTSWRTVPSAPTAATS